MPGKHAPSSPASFYLSLARAAFGAIAAIGLVVAIVIVAVTSRGGGDEGSLAGSPSPTPKASRSASAAPSESPSQQPTDEPMEEPLQSRRQLSVEIFNGTARSGLAGRTEERLNARGYRDTEVGNAGATDKTAIFFRGSLRREAERLLKDFPDLQRVRAAKSSTPGSAEITIVLGDDYEEP